VLKTRPSSSSGLTRGSIPFRRGRRPSGPGLAILAESRLLGGHGMDPRITSLRSGPRMTKLAKASANHEGQRGSSGEAADSQASSSSGLTRGSIPFRRGRRPSGPGLAILAESRLLEGHGMDPRITSLRSGPRMTKLAKASANHEGQRRSSGEAADSQASSSSGLTRGSIPFRCGQQPNGSEIAMLARSRPFEGHGMDPWITSLRSGPRTTKLAKAGANHERRRGRSSVSAGINPFEPL
jgi:hypothetical protein